MSTTNPTMIRQPAIDRVAAALADASHVAVLSHQNPDGDAVGSVLGLARALRALGKRADVFLRDGVPHSLTWLAEGEVILREVPAGYAPDAVAVLDCGEMERTGFRLEAFGTPRHLVNIDHHATSTDSFGTAKINDPAAPAAGLLVHEVVRAMGAPVDASTARAFYVALHSDTGGFRFSNTTPEAFRFAAVLAEAGADPAAVVSMLLEREQPARMHLLALVLATLHVSPCGRIADLLATRDMFAQTATSGEDTDNFVNYPRSLAGVEVAFLLKEQDKTHYRVSLRSRGRADVSLIAKKFGGGGHKNAAGATLEGTPESIREILYAEVRAALPAEPCV